ncbi:MAG: hypothetical protein Q8N17_12715 [Burkholderiaceae bacterium]|nr:hypothetical protein [Burkholderiaceae bacterium]
MSTDEAPGVNISGAQAVERFRGFRLDLFVYFQHIPDGTLLHSANAGNGIQRLCRSGIAIR